MKSLAGNSEINAAAEQPLTGGYTSLSERDKQPKIQ